MSLVDRVGITLACFKHWAIIADFENRMIAYEITQQTDDEGVNRITPQWTDFHDNGTMEKMIILGEIETSPAEVWNKVNENSLSWMEYSNLCNNCQEWAKELLAAMDPDLLVALEEKDIKPISKRILEKIGSSLSS